MCVCIWSKKHICKILEANTWVEVNYDMRNKAEVGNSLWLNY